MYIFIYKCVETGVICWVEEGPKCNVMPTINFLLFLQLNGSVNGLKPRMYYYYLSLIDSQSIPL